jgi:hypothetical protein
LDTTLNVILYQQIGGVDSHARKCHSGPPRFVLGRSIAQSAVLVYCISHSFLARLLSHEAGISFTPPAQYGFEEFDPNGILPARVYTKDELLTYLEHYQEKCRQTITGMTEKRAHERGCTA